MQAQKPYFIKEINKNIYSVEELSYYLYNYLYLVEEKFFSDALIDYLAETLEQKSIADGLKHLADRGGNLGEKISFVVKNSGYYSSKEVEELERHLVMLNSKSSAERVKAKADLLMNNHKYNLAIVFYRNILNKGRSNELGDEFYGDVYNNLGVAYTRMFEYATAAACFRSAYKLSSNIRTLENMIKADLMDGNEQRLSLDQAQYKIQDITINRLRTEIVSVKAHVNVNWDKIDRENYVKKCRDEYFVEINS
jgi:tetratricopeptide (TPR) repeat protein